MISKFEEIILSGVSDEIKSSITLSSTIFWMGGLAAWISRHSLQSNQIIDFYEKMDVVQLIFLLGGAILLIVISSAIMKCFIFLFLRLVEGYWPDFLNRPKLYLVRRMRAGLKSKRLRYMDLGNQYTSLSATQLEEYNYLDDELDNYPKNPNYHMPTRFGNILRAAEEYPDIRYGLKTGLMWPRIWLILPESTKTELGTALQVLNRRAEILAWSLAFCIWSVWTWWAFIPSLLATILAYQGLLIAGSNYGDMLRAAFDVHHFDLYKGLHLPLPISPEMDEKEGKILSNYLKRGEKMDILFSHHLSSPKDF